jgi:hypothetical protein
VNALPLHIWSEKIFCSAESEPVSVLTVSVPLFLSPCHALPLQSLMLLIHRLRCCLSPFPLLPLPSGPAPKGSSRQYASSSPSFLLCFTPPPHLNISPSFLRSRSGPGSPADSPRGPCALRPSSPSREVGTRTHPPTHPPTHAHIHTHEDP